MSTSSAFRVARAVLSFCLTAAVLSCTFKVDPDGDARFSCDVAADCGEGFECIDQVGSERGLCFPAGTCDEDETGCDGVDEDCNGATDDVSWAGGVCDTKQPGICAIGQRTCTAAEETCVPVQAARAESCNLLDDDCDGTVDEDFDLATDDQNCGMCGNVCGAGTACSFALCVERSCADGADNDGDGQADCDDVDCLSRSCDEGDPLRACGLAAPVEDAGTLDGGEDGGDIDGGGVDAGPIDAGEPDAGDGDGGADPDAGVTLVPACVLQESPQARDPDTCMNGVDDDGDEAVDCADPDCAMQVCATDGGVCQAGTCQGM